MSKRMHWKCIVYHDAVIQDKFQVEAELNPSIQLNNSLLTVLLTSSAVDHFQSWDLKQSMTIDLAWTTTAFYTCMISSALYYFK